MAGGDWVKLYRRIIDSEVFQDDWTYRLFSWCIIKANYTESKFQGTQLQRGQFVTGRMSGADSLRVSPSKFYRGLKRLESLGCITVKANSSWTTVTVCNYETYQDAVGDNRTAGEQQVNSERTASEQQMNTEKEFQEGKKERRKENTTPAAVVIPDSLQVPEFLSAWELWKQHRKEKKKPLTPTSTSQQLKKFTEWGVSRAVAAIMYTIEKGWEGIQEPTGQRAFANDPHGNLAFRDRMLAQINSQKELEDGEATE